MSGGNILVTVCQADDHLHIRVVDDGVGLPPDWRMESCAGLGIGVTRERLQALYPEQGEQIFTISQREGAGTEVSIRIPLHRTGAELRGTTS